MIAIIILMVIALMLGGLMAYQLYTVTQTQNLLIQSQKNISTMALWKSMIISKAKAVGYDNEIVLPYGDNTGDYHTLPRWIYFNNKNAWGKDIVYCPFATTNSGTANSSVKTSSSTSYNVELKENFSTIVNNNSHPYVVSSANIGTPNDVLAFIISPTPSVSSTLPTCESVSFDNSLNMYTAPNGMVETITKGDVETFANLSMLNGQNSGTNSSNAYINTVEGDSSATGNTLYQNLNYINGSNVNYVYLKLSAGNNQIQSLNLNGTADEYNEQQKIIVLEGDSSGSSVITANSNSLLYFNNYKVILKKVKISDKILLNFKDSNVSTDDVIMSNVTLNNSKLKVNGTNDRIEKSTASSAGLYLYNSELYITEGKKLSIYDAVGNASNIKLEYSQLLLDNNAVLSLYKTTSGAVDNGMLLFSSNVKTTSATIETISSNNYANDIFVDNASHLTLYNTVMNVSGLASISIANNGGVSFSDSSLITHANVTNVGILLKESASLTLKAHSGSATVIGNATANLRPNIAVLDFANSGGFTDGARYVSGVPDSGGSIMLYARSTCGAGNIFAYSRENTGGLAPINTENNYAVMTNDDLKGIMGKINSSRWTCVK